MKSELGMCQYKLGPFRRVEGWVNLSVVAFCYLEWYRWGKQQEANGKDKPFWQRLRTAGLKEKIRQQVQRAEIETLLALAGEENDGAISRRPSSGRDIRANRERTPNAPRLFGRQQAPQR